MPSAGSTQGAARLSLAGGVRPRAAADQREALRAARSVGVPAQGAGSIVTVLRGASGDARVPAVEYAKRFGAQPGRSRWQLAGGAMVSPSSAPVVANDRPRSPASVEGDVVPGDPVAR